MAAESCTLLLETLREQLPSLFVLDASARGCRIRTPLLLPDNTPISVYVDELQDGIRVSDRGLASNYAFEHGISQRAFREELARARQQYGLADESDTLSKIVREPAMGQTLFQIMSSVQDIAGLANRATTKRTAKDLNYEVERFLVQNNRSYERDVILPGRSRRRRVDYQVRGDGHRQLRLWLFDPANQKTANDRADIITMSRRDLEPNSIDSTSRIHTVAEPEYAVLINTRARPIDDPMLTDAVQVLRDHFAGRIVTWEGREELTLALAAA